MTAQYLTPEDVAKRIGGKAPLVKLARWRLTGEGPWFKTILGCRVVYALHDVEAWERGCAASA